MSGPKNERVLIVDPDARARLTLEHILHGAGFRCTPVSDAAAARDLLGRTRFDLLLCSAELRSRGAAGLVAAAQRDDDELVSVVIASITEVEQAEAAVAVGAYTYLLEPVAPERILAAAHSALDRMSPVCGGAFAPDEESLRRVAEAIEVQFAGPPGHAASVSALGCALATRLAVEPGECVLIRGASALHDIGNATLPPGLLTVPGALTEQQRDEMRGHAEAGFRMLAGSRSPLLQRAATIAWTHHERWDGSGYPRGLRGQQIPLAGRITAVADVYDSLLRDRVYRPRRSAADALGIIRDARSSAFDPDVVDALVAELEQPPRAAGGGTRAGRLGIAVYEVQPAAPPPLTPREREVLQLAADGLSTLEIASALALSPGTVKTHFQNLYAKLGAINRAAAVATALRRGIVV